MLISYEELKTKLENILRRLEFSEQKAELCSKIFADNSRDGVHSHGVNRFPVFIEYAKQGIINIHGEPKMIEGKVLLNIGREIWGLVYITQLWQ